MVKFLLSYDREDGDGDYVEEFFGQLSDELARRRAGWDKRHIGYLDVRVPTGGRWPNRLNDALSTCRVFLALYSPRYFYSEYCGKEWWIFSERVREYQLQQSREAELIIPVLWEPAPHDIPAVARPLQYKEQLFPEIYSQKGLRRIVKLKGKYSEEYDTIVNVLVDRIIDCHDMHVLAPATRLVDIATATNAFAAPVPTGATDGNIDCGGPVSGPRRVYFVMAAPTAQEAYTIRKDPGDRYGAEPDEWMPYRPEVDEPLILHANDVARQLKPPLLPRQERADEGDLVELIKQAERKNAIVILLVDAWAARLPKYRAALCPYDDFDSLHTAVIVPTNGVDSETAQHLPALQADVRAIFTKNFRGGRRFYRDAVTSLAEFRRALGEALIHTQSLVFENADVQRTVSSNEVIARPTITGPGGS